MADNPPEHNADQGLDISAGDNSGQIQGIAAKRDANSNQGDNNTIDNSTHHHYHGESSQKNPRRVRNEQTLLKAVRREVTDRLDQSLHNATYPINLAKESQPNQVKQPWDFEVKVGERRRETLPASTTVVDVFDRDDIGGKLLILGEPGAGKTTTLLDLATTILARADKSLEAAMPVLFNLSSWVDDKQSIADWLLAELKLKYGVSNKLGQQWLTAQKLLPLLDGLDELAPYRQELCVKQINAWLQSDEAIGELVVCSRIEEYENYETELALSGAICLQPLDEKQISAYLNELGKADLQAAVEQDAGLREMVRVPLHMSMAVLVYDEEFGERWKAKETAAERLSLLLDSYVINRLHRALKAAELQKAGYGKQGPPSAKQTRKWLIRLAKQLKTESKDEFLIEQMQPALLVTARQKWAYRLFFGLFIWLTFGLVTTLTIRLFVSQNLGLSSLATNWFTQLFSVVFLITWLTGARDKIELVESFDVSLFPSAQKFLSYVGLGLISGLFFGLPIWFISEWISGFFVGPGVILLLLFQDLKQDISVRTTPNEGILKSRNNTVFLTLAAIVIAIFLQLILVPWIGDLLRPDLVGAIVAISQCGLIFIVFQESGGLACIQHLALRLVLWHTGQIPWNYARFLNYCTDRLLLQRIGGRYRFIHKRLQDHFAAMDL